MKLGILAAAVAGVALGASQSRSVWTGVGRKSGIR